MKILCFLLFGPIAAAQTTATAPPSFDLEKAVEATRILPFAGKPAAYLNVIVADVIEPFASRAALKTQIELILRRNGIPLTEQTAGLTPWIVFKIRAIKPEAAVEVYAVHVGLEFRQTVTVVGQKESRLLLVAPTWEASRISLLGRSRIAESLREDCNELTESFALDYLKANPKL